MSDDGSMRIGVLLMTYGSPADLDDMPRYLAAVRGGRPAPDELVTEFRRRYALIGGSPLIPNTIAQGEALEARLRQRGMVADVAVGMRFSEPSVADGLRELAARGCDTVIGVILSPQYSELLMSGYQRVVDKAVAALGRGAPGVTITPAWYRQPSFIAAVAQRVREGLQRQPGEVRDATSVLLTAHSIPRRVADAEPGYIGQLRETAELVAEAAGLLHDRWRFCWQSAGHEPGEWMTPDFADLMPELHRSGYRSVLVAPVQFLSDHLEILYDVDIGAREQAEHAGMAFSRIESLNTSPAFIDALAALVGETALQTSQA